MHVQSTTSGLPPPLPPGSFVERLARLLRDPAAPAGGPEEDTAPTTLTPAMLRADLLAMGVSAQAEDLALAEAFAHLGLPLTGPSLAQAHAALARAPGASPLAYALAAALDLPATPAALKALTLVTGGIPEGRALPPDLMDWLGLALDPAGMDAESLAAHLLLLTRQAGRSTEHRLLAADRGDRAVVRDERATLLGLAQAAGDRKIRLGADALASHLEGQQLINLASLRAHAPSGQAPLFFAVPLLLAGEQTLAEMRLWPWEEREASGDEEEDGRGRLRATVRLATARMGRVQAELTGSQAGSLTCCLQAEKPATVRLLRRHTADLAASLAATGWRWCDVQTEGRSEWPPLWHGGEALSGPRPRIDWRA